MKYIKSFFKLFSKTTLEDTIDKIEKSYEETLRRSHIAAVHARETAEYNLLVEQFLKEGLVRMKELRANPPK